MVAIIFDNVLGSISPLLLHVFFHLGTRVIGEEGKLGIYQPHLRKIIVKIVEGCAIHILHSQNNTGTYLYTITLGLADYALIIAYVVRIHFVYRSQRCIFYALQPAVNNAAAAFLQGLQQFIIF